MPWHSSRAQAAAAWRPRPIPFTSNPTPMLETCKSFLTRAAIVVASFVASATLMAAIGAAFDGVAQPWLRDTPSARLEVARCDALAQRAARRDCLRAVVADARERDAGRSADAPLDVLAAAGATGGDR